MNLKNYCFPVIVARDTRLCDFPGKSLQFLCDEFPVDHDPQNILMAFSITVSCSDSQFT